MATTDTEVSNYSIAALGQGKTIADLETEASAEARACRRFFADARDLTLSAYQWPFATKYATLGLVEEDPTTEWAFSYRKPSDCIHIRRILSGSRNDTRQSRVSYELVGDDAGALIYTDMEDAVLEYTKRVTDIGQWPAGFSLAFGYKLAALIAPSIMGTASQKRQEMDGMFAVAISQEAARAVNENQPDEDPQSEFERSR